MEKPIDSSIKLPPIGFDEHGGLVKQSCSHWRRTLDIRGPKHHALSGLPSAAVDMWMEAVKQQLKRLKAHQ